MCLLGGTHYSTRKFALIKMCMYFGNLELPSEYDDVYSLSYYQDQQIVLYELSEKLLRKIL
jgi:hypothetical protein